MSTQQPSKVIKYALVFETIGTVFWSGFAFFRPSSLLAFFGASANSTETALGLCQIIAAITAGFALICGLAATDGPAAVAIRRFAYICIAGGEIGLCAGMLFMMSGDEQTAGSGIPNKGLWAMILQLTTPILWRIFTLTMKPHWFGADTPRDKTV